MFQGLGKVNVYEEQKYVQTPKYFILSSCAKLTFYDLSVGKMQTLLSCSVLEN